MARLLVILPRWAEADAVPNAPSGLDGDTELVFRSARVASPSSSSAHDWALADLVVLAAGQAAEREGFDAVCVGDFGDYGVGALRSVLSIPVLGAGRSAILHALTLGGRYSVLAPTGARQRGKKLVAEYGFDRQCGSIRGFEPSRDSDERFTTALAAARSCIEEDGAEVLCLAQAFEPDLHIRLGRDLPVPVVDPGPLVCKLAETFLGLGLNHSRRAYPEPMARKQALIDALAASSHSAY